MLQASSVFGRLGCLSVGESEQSGRMPGSAVLTGGYWKALLSEMGAPEAQCCPSRCGQDPGAFLLWGASAQLSLSVLQDMKSY